MKKITLAVMLLLTLHCYSQPLTTTLPTVWLRADSIGPESHYWGDVTGHGHHAYPMGGQLPVLTGKMNYNPSFELDGESFRLEGFPISDNRITAIIVYEAGDTLAEYGLWSLPVKADRHIGLTTQRILGERGHIKYTDRNRTGGVINSLGQGFKSTAGITPNQLNIGYADSLGLTGNLSEFLLFDGSVADSILTRYISYLGIKYGVTLYKTDYLNSKGQVIWNYTDYPECSHIIGGIGRDEALGLNQKQSMLMDGKVRVGLERLASDNSSNEGYLEEGDYLLWGFDSAGLMQSRTILTEEGEELQLYGEGLLQSHGSGTHILNTFMEVDGSGWAGEARDYALVIDRSGTGTYPPGASEIYYSDYVDSSRMLYFTGLHWDIDRNGIDRFSFAYLPLPASASEEGVHKRGSLNHNNSEDNAGSGHDGPAGTNQYLLYPNPNRGDFRLEVHYDVPSEISVRIYNAEGKLMESYSGSTGHEHRFEGRVPVKGHYLIDIAGGGEQKSFKMIVQ